jgi:excisionase family DNA binding protein
MLTPPPISRGKLSTVPWAVRTRWEDRHMMADDARELGRFLTLADTADMLAISVNQAYALVRSGELPAIKIGGAGLWRVEVSVLQAYIDGKYEETRRRGLWRQAAYADIPEL